MIFIPRFNYTNLLVNHLGNIEAAKAVIEILPLPPDTTLRLRHDAFQRSTRSSTRIEGNPLDDLAVLRAISTTERTGSDAEQEVRNYWRGLDRIEEFVEAKIPISEAFIQELHSLVIVRSRGRRGSRSQYRTTECPVVDTITRQIDYAPPEPVDVPKLMRELVEWLSSNTAQQMPPPIRAAIVTHRFLSIHPFDDGNGRTGRLLATTELWRSGYRMRGFFSFEEYFSSDRELYYQNLQMGLPVNFYDGRHDPEHTPWILYFVKTMAQAAIELQQKATSLYQGATPENPPWESLSRLQQQILTRLMARVIDKAENPFMINPTDVSEWFGVSDKTAREWLKEWLQSGFVNPILSGSGQRVRSYNLSQKWLEAFFQNNGSQFLK